MNSGKTIFAQLIDFLPMYEFRKCVERYNGNYKMISFSCWDQFLCLAFAQLTYRESLRDIEACLRAHQTKLYHMGFRGQVSRNTLANANQVRDWRIYADFAQVLIRIARTLYTNEDFDLNLQDLRFDHHRFVLDSFPLGQVSHTKRSSQVAYPLGFARQHPDSDLYYSWKSSRYKNPRPSLDRTWGYLSHGSRISRFRASEQNSSIHGVFRNPDQTQLQFQTSLLPPDRKIYRIAMRSNDCRDKLLREKRLSRKTKAYPLLRRREKQTPGIPNQQFFFACPDRCRTISKTLAGRIVLQMDQTTFADQGFLWNFRKCSKNPNMDCYLYLCSCSHNQKTFKSGPESLHNFTDFKCHSF